MHQRTTALLVGHGRQQRKAPYAALAIAQPPQTFTSGKNEQTPAMKSPAFVACKVLAGSYSTVYLIIDANSVT
jgi:hypothetical protein